MKHELHIHDLCFICLLIFVSCSHPSFIPPSSLYRPSTIPPLSLHCCSTILPLSVQGLSTVLPPSLHRPSTVPPPSLRRSLHRPPRLQAFAWFFCFFSDDVFQRLQLRPNVHREPRRFCVFVAFPLFCCCDVVLFTSETNTYLFMTPHKVLPKSTFVSS